MVETMITLVIVGAGLVNFLLKKGKDSKKIFNVRYILKRINFHYLFKDLLRMNLAYIVLLPINTLLFQDAFSIFGAVRLYFCLLVDWYVATFLFIWDGKKFLKEESKEDCDQ